MMNVEMIQMTENILNETSEILYQLNEQEQAKFDEVAVYFTKEEWDRLNEEEKEIYKDVMLENYHNLRFLGHIRMKPTLVSRIEDGEEPYVRIYQQPREDVFLVNNGVDLFMTKNTTLIHHAPSIYLPLCGRITLGNMIFRRQIIMSKILQARLR